MPDMPDIMVPNATKLAKNLYHIAFQCQQLVQEYLKHQSRPDANFFIPDPVIVSKAFQDMFQKLLANPNQLMQAQLSFWQEYGKLVQHGYQRMLGQKTEPYIKPAPGDKRFRDKDWAENFIYDFIKQSYLLAARSIHQAARQVDGLDEKTAEKIDFYTHQFVDAISPTNFILTNPRVLKTTLETGGENLVKGLSNMLEDMERGKGKLVVKMTDLDNFKLGENIAVTPGKVIFQTELMQLIQYTPTTERVHTRPMLIVPPWINKYYIMDLRPENSLIKWLVDQGFTVFVISWVNPDERLADMDFEHYMSLGTLAAIDAIEKATGQHEVNAIGYCIGGVLMLCTLAYLAAQGDERVKSATLFATMTDFSDPGELGVFIDEEQFESVDKGMQIRGYLQGREMANMFNMLRANDLIWSFVINNYLLGQEPFPFDLLYWNSDATRMPRKMHRFYLRNMYLENKLKEPGGITMLGVPIDLSEIHMPVYFLSTKEDHISPWRSNYAGTQIVGGPKRYVLGGSGHIAGVINPPSANKYAYWTNEELPPTPDEWLAGAEEHKGSWWPDWREWIKPNSGPLVDARMPGDGELEVIEDAPGSYVAVRGED
jgi:polyhydroxyalkanoate synthase